jgi:hypothetical protein
MYYKYFVKNNLNRMNKSIFHIQIFLNKKLNMIKKKYWKNRSFYN